MRAASTEVRAFDIVAAPNATQRHALDLINHIRPQTETETPNLRRMLVAQGQARPAASGTPVKADLLSVSVRTERLLDDLMPAVNRHRHWVLP